METIKFRSQLFIAFEHATVHLHQGQNALAKLRRSVTNKPCRLRAVLRSQASDLRRWFGGVLDAIVVLNDKTRKFMSRFLAASEQLTVPLRQIGSTFAGVRRSIAEKPRILQETLRARENDLSKLLESSLDAIVVMNMELRFVAANPKALDVFGISEKNMGMFSMEAFLPRGQILCVDENRTPLISRKEWNDQCTVRRLDGSLRVAEFISLTNYVPFRHLSMFRSDRKWERAKRFAA